MAESIINKKYSFKELLSVVGVVGSIAVIVSSCGFFLGHLTTLTDNNTLQIAEMRMEVRELGKNQTSFSRKLDKIIDIVSKKNQLKLNESLTDDYE